jgi:hypothetical protein
VRLDPANVVVVFLAALLLVYSSRRSLKPPSWDIDGSSSGSGEVQEQVREAQRPAIVRVL